MNRIKKFIPLVLLFAVLLSIPALAAVIDESKEVSIGRDVARKAREKYGECPDNVIAARVKNTGKRLTKACTRTVKYVFITLNAGGVNAISCPGGYVCITKKMVNLFPDDDELAFVLAHCMAHIEHRDAVGTIESQGAINAGEKVVTGIISHGIGFFLGNQSFDGVTLATSKNFSADDEMDADKLALTLMANAGYNPTAANNVFKILAPYQGKEMPGFKNTFLTSNKKFSEDRLKQVKDLAPTLPVSKN